MLLRFIKIGFTIVIFDMINAHIIIPARLESTRLEKKILLDKTGKYLLLHTLESAMKSKVVKNTIIATDSKEVLHKILPYYKKIYLTPANLKSGMDRCLYLAKKLNINKNSYIVNWQADEPLLNAKHVDELLTILISKKRDIGTLIAPPDEKYINDRNTVKVVISKKKETLFFFRNTPKELLNNVYFHIGLYIYKLEFLEKFTKMQSRLEQTLKLEQMRILENDYRILTHIIPKFHKGIDTIQDYIAFVKNIGTEKGN